MDQYTDQGFRSGARLGYLTTQPPTWNVQQRRTHTLDLLREAWVRVFLLRQLVEAGAKVGLQNQVRRMGGGLMYVEWKGCEGLGKH